MSRDDGEAIYHLWKMSIDGMAISYWLVLMYIVTPLSFLTRFLIIDCPACVCWDETHFGKMAGWYINRTFFFDVHPPLGKMLNAGAGILARYNGTFTFSKPGDAYPDNSYIIMRQVCASFGALLPILAYNTMYKLTNSVHVALLASMLMICDTGLLTLSRYILLDCWLLFFILLATHNYVQFIERRDSAFGCGWYFWLAFTGIALSCAVSVKFVGAFVFLFVGFWTALELWEILGDVTKSLVHFLQHLLVRIVFLIILPITLYCTFFWIHFAILYKSGQGDGFYSSTFQSQLVGNNLHNIFMPSVVAYGSEVTIKNYRIGGAYLHSHQHLYPKGVGSRQQQVTTYGHNDQNNRWRIKKPPEPDVPAPEVEFNVTGCEAGEVTGNGRGDVELLKNGDLLILEHVTTRRNLHSHRVPAPLTGRHHQVTCYGENGTGDSNDVYRVVIPGFAPGEPLQAVRAGFRLLHNNIGCALHSHSKQLPKWGWEQFEVSCSPRFRDSKTLWNVEAVTDHRLPNTTFQLYAPSFLEKLLESHAVMLQGNSGLKAKEGEVTSQPWQWPITYRGQPFSGPDIRVYLLGNPIIWWGSLVAMVIFIIVYIGYQIRIQRGYIITTQTERTLNCGVFFVVGWTLHYLPFFAMHRVLYFHHYFPALMFNLMTSALVFERTISWISQRVSSPYNHMIYHSLYTLLIVLIIYSFYLFLPLSYGMVGDRASSKDSEMYGLQWLDTWDI